MTSSAPALRVAVDAVIFTVQDKRLKVLLIQMKKAPFTGLWAFPGGLMEADETAMGAAKRILATQTNLPAGYLEQLATFDALDRDPLGRVVSVSHFALLPCDDIELKTTEKYGDVRWCPVDELPNKMAYDHAHMAKVACERLRGRLSYTNIAWSLLPSTFTLSELQQIYETILGEAFDKRNFRKKILSLGMIKPVANKRRLGHHRPAQLYRFKTQELAYVEAI